MRSSRGVLHNLSILTVGQAASQLLNVWALVFLADRLGAHWFGVVQVGVAFMGYALVVAEGGLFNLGIREVSRLDARHDVLAFARTQTGMLALQAFVVLGAGLLVLPLLPFSAADPWIIGFYLAAVVPQVFQFEWVATGLEKMPWVGAARTVRSLVYALLVLLALEPLAGATAIPAARWVPLLFLAAMSSGNVLVAIAARRWLGGWLRPGLTTAAELSHRWHEALPIGTSNVVLRVLLNIDLIVLGLLAAPQVAGHYAAASRVIFLLVVAVEVLWSALLPRQSRLAARDPAAYRRTFNLYLGCLVAALLPVAVGGRLLGAELIAFLYRGQYAESAPVLANLAVSYSLLAVAMYLGNSLVAADRQRDYVRPLAVSAAVAAAATALLVPDRGAVGASWGMLAGHTLLALALAVVVRRLFARSLGVLLPSLLPALAGMAYAVEHTSSWSLPPRVVAGAAVYAAAAALPLRRFLRVQRVGPAVAGNGPAP